MKNIVFFVGLFLAIFCREMAMGQESGKTDKQAQADAAFQEVVDLVASGKYEFDASKANPQRGRQVDLTTNPGFLRVNKGHAMADLPYMGVAQTAPYSGDVGIKFDGEVTSYKVNKNKKKNKITITFKISGKGERFNCTLSVAGSADHAILYITSTRRDSISYYGSISELKE